MAVCDLATLLEDVAELLPNVIACDDHKDIDYEAMLHRLNTLGLETSEGPRSIYISAIKRLKQSIGCTSSAIAYLHQNQIRHKDIKPSNILLSATGLWVTDFGTSTDFSTLTESVTQNGERGTPKYFAPEVAAFEPNGRSADIFSLGCMFLEVIGMCNGYSLEYLQSLRPNKDRSFQANLDSILDWFSFGNGTQVTTLVDQHLMGIVREMLSFHPEARPTASEIETQLRLINALRVLSPSTPLWARCCDVNPPFSLGGLEIDSFMVMTITIGNFHHWDGSRHEWKFFIKPSVNLIIDKTHIFLVCPVFC